MEIIKIHDGENLINLIPNNRNDVTRHHFYYKSLNFIFFNEKYYLFDLDVDKEFINDIKNLEYMIGKKHYFLIYDSVASDFKIIITGNQLFRLFISENNLSPVFNQECFIPTFNVIKKYTNGFPDFNLSEFSDYKSLADLNFSDIKDYNIKVENAIKEFDNTLNNVLFYKRWKEFENETKLDLKKYRKVSSLIRPFKVNNFLNNQEVNYEKIL